MIRNAHPRYASDCKRRLWAAEWLTKPGDVPSVTHRSWNGLAGRTLTFYDDGQSKFSAGGAYSYTYASGESAFGTYSIARGWQRLHSQYRNGFGRCDLLCTQQRPFDPYQTQRVNGIRCDGE